MNFLFLFLQILKWNIYKKILLEREFKKYIIIKFEKLVFPRFFLNVLK